jgi:hypothetical protein
VVRISARRSGSPVGASISRHRRAFPSLCQQGEVACDKLHLWDRGVRSTFVPRP